MRRALLLGGLILGVGVGAWWVLRDGASGPPDDGVRRPAAEAAETVAPRLRGSSSSEDESIPVNTVQSDDAPVATSPTATEGWWTEGGRVVLRAELSAPVPVAVGDVCVRVFPVVHGWVQLHGGRDPAYVERRASFAPDLAVEVTDLLAVWDDPVQVEVEIAHPDHVTVRRRVDVPARKPGTLSEVHFGVALVPALVAMGVLVDPQGRPAKHGEVAAFVLGPNGPTVEMLLPIQAVTGAIVQEDGQFRLKFPAPGRYLVVGSADGVAATAREVDVREGEATALGELELLPAATIEGTVLIGGQPAAAATVLAFPEVEDGTLPLALPDSEVLWSPGHRLWSQSEAETDAMGRFRIEGLAPGLHRLRAWGAEDVGAAVRARLLAPEAQCVTAPARGVVLRLEEVDAVVVLRVAGEGGPIPAATVHVTTAGIHTIGGTTHADGSWRSAYPAGAEIAFRIEKEGFEAQELVVRTGSIGSVVERDVFLPTGPAAPVVHLHLKGEASKAVGACHVVLVPIGEIPRPTGPPPAPLPRGGPPVPLPAPPPPAAGPPLPVQAASAASRIERWETPEGGVCRIPVPSPSTYLLRVQPARAWQSTAYFLRWEGTIEVGVAGDLDVHVDVRLGGRLSIAATDKAGTLLPAACTVRNAEGVEQAVIFEAFAERMTLSHSDTLPTLSRATVSPALPAGRYTVDFELEGYHSERVEVDIRQSATRDIDVTLHR